MFEFEEIWRNSQLILFCSIWSISPTMNCFASLHKYLAWLHGRLWIFSSPEPKAHLVSLQDR